MGALSESVKGSARAGTTWGFAVVIAGMLGMVSDEVGDEIKEFTG